MTLSQAVTRYVTHKQAIGMLQTGENIEVILQGERRGRR
jgi:hypothetical protein